MQDREPEWEQAALSRRAIGVSKKNKPGRLSFTPFFREMLIYCHPGKNQFIRDLHGNAE